MSKRVQGGVVHVRPDKPHRSGITAVAYDLRNKSIRVTFANGRVETFSKREVLMLDEKVAKLVQFLAENPL